MNRKKWVGMLVVLFVLVILFAGITDFVMNGSDSASQTAENSESRKDESVVVDISAKEAADGLVDQTVARDEIEERVGKWNDFEMDGNGCERGVYAGRFYYDGFTIYSRTYDKGETFHVMSINE